MSDTATTPPPYHTPGRPPSRRTSPSPAARPPSTGTWPCRRRRADPLHGRRRPHRPRRPDDRRRPVHALRRVPGVRPGIVSPTTLGGTPFSMHVEVPDVDAVYARVVADGAPRRPEPHDEAYGARSFDMIDPFGHRWMIQTPIATPTIEEIQVASDGFTITAAPTEPVASAPSRSATSRSARPTPTCRAQFYGALFSLGDRARGKRRRVYARRQHEATRSCGWRPGPPPRRRGTTSETRTRPSSTSRVRRARIAWYAARRPHRR